MNRILILVFLAASGWLVYDVWQSRAAVVPVVPVAEEPVVPSAPPSNELDVHLLSDGLPRTGQWRGRPVLRDLDGDSHCDLVAAVRRYDRDEPGEGIWVFRGDGAGHWTPAIEGLRRDMGYGGAEVADVDGDGTLDIAYSGHDVPPHLFMNARRADGTGTWVANDSGIDCESICIDVALGDYDGDGDVDLAAMGQMPRKGGLFVYAGDGLGTFSRTGELLPTAHYGADVRIVDLDGDGRGEIVAATDTGPRVWRRDVEAEQWIDVGQGMPKPIIGGADMALLALDVDGEGWLELVAGSIGYRGYPSLVIYRRAADGTWQPMGSGLPDELPWYDLALARFGAERRPSLVAAGKHGVFVIDVAQDGTAEVRGHLRGTTEVLNVIAGDVDGDGCEELAWVGFDGVTVAAVPAMVRLTTSKGEPRDD